MGLTLVTDASTLPWTLAEFVAEIVGYVQSSANDNVCTAVLNATTKWVQNQTCRQFIQATWKQTLNDWPEADSDGFYSVKLDLSPLASITTVKYYNTSGTLTTVSSGDYWTITTSIPPRLTFNPSEFDWPTLQDGRPDPIEVTFVAGYGAAGSSVPHDLKRAIQLLARYWYEINMAASPVLASQSPMDAQPVKYGEVPFGVWSIVNMYKADGYT